MVNPGASGADAEKQAWLAKYATGPSAEPSAPGVLSGAGQCNTEGPVWHPAQEESDRLFQAVSK